MNAPWPHAPPHSFAPNGLYMLTAGTLHKARLFDSPEKLDLLQDQAFSLCVRYRLVLHAWAFLANHYHLIAGFEDAPVPHRRFIGHLHSATARELNRLDEAPGRKVFYQFWDTELTFEKSWLARLHYVHQNPARHGVVGFARDYPWCSARWFESNARPAFVKSVYSFKTDRLNVPDEF